MVLRLVSLSVLFYRRQQQVCVILYVKVTNMSPGICCDDESNSYNSQICLLCVIYISFLPTMQAKLQQGLTNCQKKPQNCCYFHFDPFRNVIMRLIKKLTYLTLAFIVFFRVFCTGNDLNILGFFILIEFCLVADRVCC